MVNPTKNNQSHTEIRRSGNNNIEIEETKNFLITLEIIFLKKKDSIRLKFYVKETADKYLKELEEKRSLTKQEKKDKKRYTKILQKAEEYFKKLK